MKIHVYAALALFLSYCELAHLQTSLLPFAASWSGKFGLILVPAAWFHLPYRKMTFPHNVQQQLLRVLWQVSVSQHSWAAALWVMLTGIKYATLWQRCPADYFRERDRERGKPKQKEQEPQWERQNERLIKCKYVWPGSTRACFVSLSRCVSAALLTCVGVDGHSALVMTATAEDSLRCARCWYR